MERMFAYIRVSTTKQGQGVSLEQQQRSITEHASRNDYMVIKWFEEKRTAAKRGRPAFTDMMKRLRKGEASGVIIHKIDRSARNLRDWADLGDLIDQGINVQFAHDNIDLTTRGGRLSADLQATIAADYVRNLREEIIKGIYGRLNQGLYPFAAPTGYLDTGRGNVKTVDPIKAPLVHVAFSAYASGCHSLRSLRFYMAKKGLVSPSGNPLSPNSISKLLRNPFYTGIIRISTTGELFTGNHKPIIDAALYQEVQTRLDGKISKKTSKHKLAYNGFLRCGNCGYFLSGEKQKGNIYYRCHTKKCETKSIREDRLISKITHLISHISIDPLFRQALETAIDENMISTLDNRKSEIKTLKLRIAQTKLKLSKLTDYALDGTLTKSEFISKKNEITDYMSSELQNLATLENTPTNTEQSIKEILTWCQDVCGTYKTALPDDLRETASQLTSNSLLTGKKLLLELKKPYDSIADSLAVLSCDPARGDLRNVDEDCAYCSKEPSLDKSSSDEVARNLLEQLTKNESRWMDNDTSVNL